MRPVLLLAVAALSACSTYARVAHTNAPGIVDISTPVARENGSDELFEVPDYAQPARSYIAMLMPAFGGGLLRHGTGLDLSVGLAIEKDQDGGTDLIARNAWGAEVGLDIVQFHTEADHSTTIKDTAGPFWVEAYRRKFIVIVGAGPVIYPDTKDLGAQITVHAPLIQARVRWAQDTGFEATFAYELALPAVFGWSR